ncbi:hypothetical protein C8J55DRAFT_539112 [Lentinula edodes]|uniref:Choline/ethanolaminephosphotransferase n=1 Tax=Lentinula lateritia TaxID=40482 RepID=A0A9W8ZQ85_9AGAR|nr:hypothetical protein C8J55DRAFT_539112 [Lentinula edodes]
MGNYLSDESLQSLKKYTYRGVDKSILSKYAMNSFWTWFVTLFPLSIAPNTITLSGLCIVIFNFFTLLYYYLTKKAGWGIGLFLYQAFDAADGTGMAGPLGEMFDHGTSPRSTRKRDAILVSPALNLGRSWWTLASQVATLANFYLTTWEEYHTGAYLASYTSAFYGVFSGPVEGILILVAIYMITGVYGPSFWNTPILDVLHLSHIPLITSTFSNIGLNVSSMVFGAFGLAFNILSTPSFLPSNSPTPSFPGELELFTIRNSALFIPFLCAWGLQFAHQVGRMILAHLTKMSFPVWDWLWLLSLVGAVDANLPRIAGTSLISQSTPLLTALYVHTTLLISFISYARNCVLMIHNVRGFMGIVCFTVRKKDKEGDWRNATGQAPGAVKVEKGEVRR